MGIQELLRTSATILGWYPTSAVKKKPLRTNISEVIKQLSENTNHDLAIFNTDRMFIILGPGTQTEGKCLTKRRNPNDLMQLPYVMKTRFETPCSSAM